MLEFHRNVVDIEQAPSKGVDITIVQFDTYKDVMMHMCLTGHSSGCCMRPLLGMTAEVAAEATISVTEVDGGAEFNFVCGGRKVKTYPVELFWWSQLN